MPDDLPKSDPNPPGEPPLPGKKKWEKPTIQSGQLFEANSLSCGKNDANNEQCLQAPTQS